MISIRELSLTDIPEMASISVGQPTAPPWHKHEFVVLFAPEAPSRIMLAAKNPEGALVGFVIARPVADEAELESIVVSPIHQRQGIAQRLLFKLVEKLRQMGVRKLHLEVRPSNLAANALYLAMGFRIAGSRPIYYSDPVEDALLMKLEVNS